MLTAPHVPRIAIVDSGIDPTHEAIGAVHHVHLDAFSRRGSVNAGHGTACAGIVLAKVSQGTLYSVPIFDENLTAPGSALIAAILWSMEHGMDVVNLSLGTTDLAFRDDLADVCHMAARAGVVLVAAGRNDGRESYPAVLPDVIGVGTGPVDRTDRYYFRPEEPIECLAWGGAQRVCWTAPRYRIVSGASFAAPHISGLAANIRRANPEATVSRVRELLQESALPEECRRSRFPPDPAVPISRSVALGTASTTCMDLSWMKKVTLFPFNKEMHALIHGRDLLHFEIVGIADPVGKGLVGQDSGEALNQAPNGLRIQPRLGEALVGADTLILGYVGTLSRIGKKDVLGESVTEAIRRGVNVFSFVPVPPALHDLARPRGLRIATPGLSQREIQAALGNDPAYPPVDVPVLGVFGTSPQQGKFTLQLALRRQLLRRGYGVGQVGTEHHSSLFGMDVVFPMGYASTVCLPLESYVPFLDYKMRELCQKRRPEIILVGSQSGTVPYDLYYAAFSLSTPAFLLGTKPDACILVVNSIDEEAYIQDSIDGIRALAKAPTLALAMSDQEKSIRATYGRTFIKQRPLEPAEHREKLERLEERFGLPAVAILSESDHERLIDIVIDHFAKESP